MSAIDSSQIPSLAVPQPQGRTHLRQSLRDDARECADRTRAGELQRGHHHAAHSVAPHVRHQRAGRHPLRGAGQCRELHQIRGRPPPAGAGPRPRAVDQRGRDLAPPSPHHGAVIRSAQRRRLRADHDRGDAGAAGEVGRAAGGRENRCRGGDDARDLAHYLARDVLLRLRRDRRCRRGRRQPVSDDRAAEPARSAAHSAMADAPARRRSTPKGFSTSSTRRSISC